MEGITDRELICAAFELGANFGREGVVSGILGLFELSLTPEMVERLSGYRDGITLSGYEPFEPITSLQVPPEVHTRLLNGNPKILIIAQLSQVTSEALVERYKLTDDEVDLVRRGFEFGYWRLRPSTPATSS